MGVTISDKIWASPGCPGLIRVLPTLPSLPSYHCTSNLHFTFPGISTGNLWSPQAYDLHFSALIITMCWSHKRPIDALMDCEKMESDFFFSKQHFKSAHYTYCFILFCTAWHQHPLFAIHWRLKHPNVSCFQAHSPSCDLVKQDGPDFLMEKIHSKSGKLFIPTDNLAWKWYFLLK